MRGVLLASAALIAAGATPALAQTGSAPNDQASAPLNTANQPPPTSPTTTPQQAPPSATAAAPPVTVGEVIVTAQRRSENLQNVPIAVQAVSPAQLASSSVSNLQGLSAIVPGVQTTVSAGNSNNYIRGVGSQVTGPGLESPVALYVDGVYYSSTYGAPTELTDISQLEVLKGPQGTLFGRNATGGLIQITTRTPTQQPHLDTDFSYSNYDTSKFDFYGSTGLLPNLASDVDLVVSHQGDGYGTNFYNGKDTDKDDLTLVARSKSVYTPFAGTRITTILDYNQVRTSINSLRIEPGTTVPAFLGQVYGGDRYDTDVNTQPLLFEKGGGASLRIEQDLKFADLVDTVAYRQNTSVTELDIDTTPTNFTNAAPARQSEKEITQELQLSSKQGSRITWTTGIFYYNDDASIGENVVTGPVFRLATKSPLTGEFVYGSQTSKSASVYGQASYEILPATNLTVGGRYTFEERAFDGNQNALIGALTLPLIRPTVSSKDYYRETYRVALDHRFSPEILAYGAINTGFKSGGYNALSTNQPPFGLENITAYSGGIKTDLLDRRLRVNIEGFYYDYSSLQQAVILLISPGVTAPGVVNGATAHVYGLDGDFTAQITRDLNISGGVELLHSRFASSDNDFVLSSISGATPALDNQSVSGNTRPFSPDAVFNLGGNYIFNLLGGEADANLTYQYNTGYYVEADNIIHQGAFSMLNASVRWKSPDRRYTVALYGKNVTDSAVIQNGLTVPYGPHATSYLPPATYGFTVGYHF